MSADLPKLMRFLRAIGVETDAIDPDVLLSVLDTVRDIASRPKKPQTSTPPQEKAPSVTVIVNGAVIDCAVEHAADCECQQCWIASKRKAKK